MTDSPAAAIRPAISSAGRSNRRGGARTLLIAVTGGLAVVAAGVGAVSMSTGGSGEETPLDLHPVSQMSFDVEIIASGELEALQQTEIRSELESQATINWLVDEGVHVEKGDTLVKLNSEAIETSVEDELLKVETARSDLIAAENGFEIQKNQNEADLRSARLKLDLAQIELRKWEEGDLVKKLEDLTLAIDQAERRLEQRKEAYEQSQRLFDRGFLASDQLKNDEIAYIDAQASLKTAKSNEWVYKTFEMEKKRKQLTSDVEEAVAQLERVKRQNASRLASKEADLTNRRRQLQIREDRLAKLRQQLEYTTVIAPTDGLVVYGTTAESRRRRSSDGPMEIGQTVRPNELLVVLPDTQQMIAKVRVHEANAGLIDPGQKATVKIDAIRDHVFDAEVMDIGVLAETGGWRDPNLREYTVRLLIEAPNGQQSLKPSMRCESEIVVASVHDALAVPAQAVFRDDGETFVYTPAGTRYERTPVRVGRRSMSFAEIQSGVAPGQRVLLREPQPGEVRKSAPQDESAELAETPEDSETPAKPKRADGRRAAAE